MTTQRVRQIIIALYLIVPIVMALTSITVIEEARAIRAANGLPVGERLGLLGVLLGAYAGMSPALIFGFYLSSPNAYRQGFLEWLLLAMKQVALRAAARLHSAAHAGRKERP